MGQTPGWQQLLQSVSMVTPAGDSQSQASSFWGPFSRMYVREHIENNVIMFNIILLC